MLKFCTNLKDIEYILKHLRKEDKKELEALYGNNWYGAVLNNLSDKDILILSGINNKKEIVPIAMGGFYEPNTSDKSLACVWLLCSYFIDNNKHLLAKTLKNSIEKASKRYEIMYNYIYKSNYEAKGWLKRLGFNFNNPTPDSLKVLNGFEFFYKLNKREE